MSVYQALADGSADKGEHILPAGGFEPLKNPKMMHAGAVTAIKIQPSTELLYSGGADRCIKVLLQDRFRSRVSPFQEQGFAAYCCMAPDRAIMSPCSCFELHLHVTVSN